MNYCCWGVREFDYTLDEAFVLGAMRDDELGFTDPLTML